MRCLTFSPVLRILKEVNDLRFSGYVFQQPL